MVTVPQIHDGSNSELMETDLIRWVYRQYPLVLPILDVGCRNMPQYVLFEELAFHKLGVNLMLHRDYVGLDLVKLKNTVQSDAYCLPFKNEVFGVIFCGETLEHCENPVKVVGEWGRTLKQNGLAIVTTVQEWPYHPEPEDYYRFKPEALSLMFEANGLLPVTMFSIGGGLGVHSNIVGVKRGTVKTLDETELAKHMGKVTWK